MYGEIIMTKGKTGVEKDLRFRVSGLRLAAVSILPTLILWSQLALTQELNQQVFHSPEEASAALLAAAQQTDNRALPQQKEIKTLADEQAALLAKFIVANVRMQSEIYRLLTPEQQRKLDDLKRSGESGTVASR
jgi:hypothetical protein